MKIRHVLSFLLAVVMLTVSLASCLGEAVTTETTTNEETTTTVKSGESSDPTVDSDDWLSGYLDKMPTFVINTEGSAPIVSKEEYLGATITVNSTEEAYNIKNADIEIRGRGNYTWTSTAKKSYRIKFAEKVNLLGQGGGPARSWTLLAVHCDQSLLRTAAALTLASKMPGISYSSSVRFVRLLLNGEYMGVYQVSEQMQVQEYRVNIDDTITEGKEIGFLVELDKRASDVPIYDGFGNSYELKSEYYSAEQLRYISDCLWTAFEAITTGDKDYISEYIDLESVVDAYIVEELFKNLDVGWGSFYMYQDVGDKLHFGPLWDFDLSAGNADPDNGDQNFSKPQYIYVGDTTCNYQQSHSWFKILCEFDWFNDMIKERWFALSDIINEVPSYVRRVAALYSSEFDENFVRWPIFGSKINREPVQVRALRSHDAHAEYLAWWLEQRISWLNNYYNGEVSADSAGDSSTSDYTFTGGNGTKSNPYLVATAKDFYEFTTAMLFGEKFSNQYFKQTADIDMSGYVGYNGIGSSGTFAGTYNGNGYGITVTIEGSDECIFPYVTGTVMNLVTYGSINNSQQAAGITRSVRKTGVIVNCASYITLTSSTQAAGIVASNQEGGGTVSGCFFGGVIDCSKKTGAINYFIDGRGGEFSYNYCLNTTVGNSVGNETIVNSSDLSSTVKAMNGNLSKLSGGVDDSLLCEWKQSNGKLVLISK